MRIHRNLHNARHGGPQWVHTVRGKVEAYLDSVLLVDVTTRIQPAGQAKCQTSGVRSVCAFFDGVQNTTAYVGTGSWDKVVYDPRVDDAFLSGHPSLVALGSTSLKRWNTADAVRLTPEGECFVLGARWVE